MTHQTYGTDQGPREMMEPSTSTACLNHRGPTAKPCCRQAQLLTNPTQNQRLLRAAAEEVPSMLLAPAAVTDNHYLMTGAFFEMSLADLRQGLQSYQHHKLIIIGINCSFVDSTADLPRIKWIVVTKFIRSDGRSALYSACAKHSPRLCPFRIGIKALLSVEYLVQNLSFWGVWGGCYSCKREW